MRPPKQPRRSAPKVPQQQESTPSREPVRESAPRKPAPEAKPASGHKAARGQAPEREPASTTPGISVRAGAAKLRRERTKKEAPKTPVPEHRKRSSEPYPLSEKIKLRRRAERKRLVIRLGIALSVIALISGIVWMLFFSSLFAVKAENIRFTIEDPAGIIEEVELETIVRTAEGTPVLRLDAGALEDQLEERPEVQSAKAAGSLPNGINILIVAREPVACVGPPDSCVGISEDATQLEITDELRDQLPNVTMDLDSDRAADHLESLLDAIAALPDDVRTQVVSASVSTSGLIEFSTETAVIKWGTSDENDLKARIIEVLLDEPAGTYDVTVPGAPVTY